MKSLHHYSIDMQDSARGVEFNGFSFFCDPLRCESLPSRLDEERSRTLIYLLHLYGRVKFDMFYIYI